MVFDTVFDRRQRPPTLTVDSCSDPTQVELPTAGRLRGVASTEQANRHCSSVWTMSWARTSAVGTWASVAVAIRPAAAAGPTVTINQAVGQDDPTATSPIHFTAVFSEAVTGFETGDVTLSGTAGATTATVTGSGTTYDVAVSGMTGSGTVVVNIPAGVAQNGSAQTNAASTSTDKTVTYDVTGPSVTVNQAAAQNDPTPVSPINFTVVFDETVADFTADDVTLSGSTAPGVLVAEVTGSGTTYNVAVSGMTDSGDVVASLAAGAAHDALGNPSDASTSTDNSVAYDYDGTPPTVTIDQAATQGDPTGAAVVDFTVIFSEPVADFTAGGVTLTDSTAPGTLAATVTGTGTTYNVRVTGMTDAGDVVAKLLAGVAHDAAGNPSAASTSIDNSVTYNPGPPPGLDGAASSNSVASAGSISFAHTTGSGSDRLVLVGVSWNCGSTNRTIESVTFTPDGGDPISLTEVLTQLGYSTSNPRYSAIWYVAGDTNVPSGAEGTVTITFSGSVSNGIMAGAANFAGVDPTTPLGTPRATAATPPTSPVHVDRAHR